jgi:hypothetical protein
VGIRIVEESGMTDLLERQAAAGDPTNPRDWAYTPDTEKTSTWRLRIDDRQHAIAAAMALGPGGFRGQKVDIPSDALAGVKAKIRAALTRFGVSDDAQVWQYVKAAENSKAAEPDISDLHVPGLTPNVSVGPNAPEAKSPHFLKRIVKAIKEHFSQQPAMTRDEFQRLHVQARAHAGGKAKAEAQTASETPFPGARALLLRLEGAKDNPNILDPSDEAKLLEAGLTRKADKGLFEITPKGRAILDATPTAAKAADWGLPTTVYPTGPMPQEPVPWDDEEDEEEDEPIVLFEKADKRVNYRMATQVGRTCQDCQNFDEECSSCRLVEGTINENAVCDLFQPETEDEPQSTPSAAHELFDLCAVHRASDTPTPSLPVPTGGGESGSSPPPSYRLFYELREFVTPPDWIPLLPRPGRYEHPSYGTITITPERVARFVQHFNAGIYQKPVPIDAEHETSLSGALGWITELRVNSDGSADGRSEWTDRGRSMLEADRFRFISPTWFDLWSDPATGHKYEDIVSGAALCRKPFFKPPNLRPLVASEGGLTAPDPDPAILTGANTNSLGSTAAPVTFHANAAPRPSSAATGTTTKGASRMTDPQNASPPAATDDLARRYTEMETKFAAMESARATEQAALKAATEQLAAIQATERRKRFTDIVLGRDGAGDGARWFGDVAKHVSLMERLATTFGEDSDDFKAFVEQQRATAEQVRAAGLYREIGTGARFDDGRPSVHAEIEAKAREFAEAAGTKPNDALALAQAKIEALRANPALYERAMAEERRENRRRAEEAGY